MIELCFEYLSVRCKWASPNGWVFIYELSGSRFKSSCSHLNFSFRACFEQGVPWHSGVQLQSVDSLWNAYVTWQEDTIFINRNFLGCFRFVGNLIPVHSFSSRLNKKYVIWWWFAQSSIFAKNIVSVLKKVWSSTTHVEQVNEASYWLIYH